MAKGPVVASAEEQMAWIEEIVAMGLRRPGYAGDEAAEKWAAGKFADLGLEDITLDPVPLLKWPEGQARLEIWPEGKRSAAIKCVAFMQPYSAACSGLRGRLTASAGAGRNEGTGCGPQLCVP